MPFQSGRVSFCRFRVHGDAPAQPDETALAILSDFAFKETEIGAPDEVEIGFITGQHILDTQFTYEKNGFGSSLLFALRMDTHKPPSEIKKAYKQIHEQAASAASATGFASKAEKRRAAEEAQRQLHDDLAAGKFRRSKSVPLLWDLKTATLYCGAAGNTVIEKLTRLMKDAFAVDLQYLSAGSLAGVMLRDAGRGRDYEDLKPSAFTPPPPAARENHEDADGPRDLNAPLVPWVAQAVDLKDFLGNEFAFWLWRCHETADGRVEAGKDELYVTIDKALDMDCAWDAGGKQTLRGHAITRLPEAGDALRTGKWPRKLGLLIADGEHHFEVTLQVDKMAVSSAVLPEVEDAQSPRELIESRLQLTAALAGALDNLYRAFLDQRTRSGWSSRRGEIRDWIVKRLEK